MKVVDIARLCHEANKAICETFGDMSQLSWDLAEQWQRDSAIKGVQFTIDNMNATPEDQHNAWMADKIVDGWCFGAEKDATKKTHPCIVAYDQLPPEQRVKDHVFRAIVVTTHWHMLDGN